MARFEREARLLASLNHPGIAAIFGVGSAAGQRATITLCVILSAPERSFTR